MQYYEVFVADIKYKGDVPLTYSYEDELTPNTLVTVPLRKHYVNGLIYRKVKKPNFIAKPIKTIVSSTALPSRTIDLAKWISEYYISNLGEALKLFSLPQPAIRIKSEAPTGDNYEPHQLSLEGPLTDEQSNAVAQIKNTKRSTVLLHGDTGTGKTRVYIELTKSELESGRSVIILTPEISLTSQLVLSLKKQIGSPIFIFHSQLTYSQRKKIWLSVLESSQPLVIIGARSALFSPIGSLGLIILDEAHEPSYKQDQKPRYHASRVASQIALTSGAKVILGTATPLVSDYFIARQYNSIVRMKKLAMGGNVKIITGVIDKKDRSNFTRDSNLSNDLLESVAKTISNNKQVLIYLNRRGSARLILCNSCGWQMLCPNCYVSVVYHGDIHKVRCHICGFTHKAPEKCPQCSNLDIIYTSIGTKSLADTLMRLFPNNSLQRFDSDNKAGERINEAYSKLSSGQVDIIVGTQILAKGFDLPKLGLVGVLAAEDSLTVPDYTSAERMFQLLYQVVGRVGRGHSEGRALIQTYYPESIVLKSAVERDYESFYDYMIKERQQFKFPPFSYLLKLTVKKSSPDLAAAAAERLRNSIFSRQLPIEILGPAPSYYSRRGKNYYWQLVIKSKERAILKDIAKNIPIGWAADADPNTLL
jgi:primosomal protein N' (replication factor Y)